MATSALAKSLIRMTGEVGDQTCDPWTGTPARYPLHYHSSYWFWKILGQGSTVFALCAGMYCLAIWLFFLSFFLSSILSVLFLILSG